MIRFDLTDEDAERLVTGKDTPPGAPAGPQQVFADQPPDPDDTRVFLGLHNMAEGIVIGCFDCEQMWSPDAAKTKCPGEPAGYRPDGEPLFDRGGRLVPLSEAVRP